MCLRGFKGEVFVFGEKPPLRFGGVRATLFVAASGIIPVAKSLDGRKRMVAGAEDAARSNLLKKDRLGGRLVIYQISGQNYMGYIYALFFSFIQPL